ncbi:hypothetical protein SLEP1_g45482 [Rubroshorea leprosula]|uniref:RNA-directed DNA polymerase n=1 Tax=Rubroshorea leprosula TaxID=152421 RepID=A0AAV5LKX2_9ROSI|nr:hypothetical protein SLEP1_g45482 [Rubroshorea leprosula]
MVRTFIGSRPPRNEMDEQEDTQLSEPGLNDFRPMPRNLFPEHFQIPTGTRQRYLRPSNLQQERPERSIEPARTTELEERTRVLEMAMGRILALLIPDNPLIPLLNRDAQPATVVATRNSPALSNIVVQTKPRGSGKLNNEPSSSKHSEELMRKNADLERQLRDVQKSIDELKSPRSHKQTLDLDSAPLNLSITTELYQEGFKIPHLETYDGSATLKSTARRWYHKLPRHSIDSYSQLAKLFSNKFVSQREIKRTATELMQVHQKEGESLRDYMQQFNKATLDIDNVLDTICLSALLHGLKPGRFLDDLLENPPKTWNEVNDRSASFILSEDFQSSKRRADDKQGKSHEQPLRREQKKKQKVNEQWGKPVDFLRYANYISLTLPRTQILAQIQHWIRRPPPPLHDSPRADKSNCDYHCTYGHNTEDCQHLKDELEFLARNGKLEGYVQKPYTQQPSQTHFVQGYDRPQGQRYQLGGTQDVYQDSQYPSEQGRAYRGHPFVAMVHIGNHNVNKVFIDTGSSPDILYWSCFQKMQLNPSSLQKYEGPIYGFDNQHVPVQGVITLPIYVGLEPRFRMASVNFLVVKMESAFNAILGRATLCELKAVISQPHLYMKFPTPQRVGVLKGNQKMARACYQDTFKKVELAVAPGGPSGEAELVEPVETVPLNPDVRERTVKIGTKLTEEERAELLEFLRVNQDVFAWTTDEMPRIPVELTFHKLSTDPTKRPVMQKRRLFGPEKQAAIDEEIQKLLQAGFIRRVEYSEWVSNPALVKKPNGKWRMCIDFTNLNEACPKDPHPLPNVEKLVERAAGHERMSFLDASSGYHQVQLLLDNQEKIAFYAGDAIYCYVMMPFGLKNAGATYQKLVQIIFKLQIGRNIEVYVDDMIVTSVQAEDHIDNLNETFQNLRRAQMKLNPLKCTFAVESGKFLGYVVSKKGIEVNPEKVQAVQQMEPPRTVKDVQRLTGRVAALHSTPVVQACGRESLYLYLGVMEEAVSSVLLREENKNQKPICYVSKVLQGAEQNYPLAEKAAFALLRTTIKGQAVADFLVECISATVEEKAPEHPVWVLYVDGAANVEGSGAGAVLVGLDGFKSEHALRFKFQTTNNAAEYKAQIYGLKLESELKVQSIQVFSDSQLVVRQVNGNCEIRDPQLGCYASVVNRLKSGFVSFQIDKIPRADNHRADELSKLASSQDLNPQRSTIIEVLDAPSYTDFIVECQLLSTDPSSPSWTTPLIEYLRSGELPKDHSAAKLIKRRAAHFTLLYNQLYKRAASMPLLRCLTPYETEYAVREVHEGVCGTHIGGRTLARKLLRHGYYWPTMVEDAQNYVKKYPTCQFNADDIHMPGEMLSSLSSLSSSWPFAQWGVDLLGPFVKGKRGCIYLMVAVDYFTKWIEAKPLSTTTEKKIEEFLFNSILCRFGIPKRIIADNGSQFRAAALRSFCNDYGIELALTSVYTPQSNGLATGETPFSLAYGVEAIIPVEIGLPSDRADRHNDDHNEQLLRENLDVVEEIREIS